MSNNTNSLVARSSMLIGPNDYERIFRDIQSSLQSSDEKNIIVCASTSECDSVCGIRILQASASLLTQTVHLQAMDCPQSRCKPLVVMKQAVLRYHACCVQQLLMNNGIHFSMYPVSGFGGYSEDLRGSAHWRGRLSEAISMTSPPPFAHGYARQLGPKSSYMIGVRLAHRPSKR